MNNPLSPSLITKLVRAALREDIGSGDITTIACVEKESRSSGIFIAISPGILCGVDVALTALRTLDPSLRIVKALRDGAALRRGVVIARVTGNTRALLSAERTALNFLQRLSGIATLTREFVDAVRGTRAVILDTRKTTPLLRALEKYAVRIGGGANHRSRLDEMVLIKDNHIAAAGSVANAIARCRRIRGKKLIEIETTTLGEIRAVLAAGQVDRIMLDNFSLARIGAAVKLIGGRVPIEVSGGVNLTTIRAIAETGVDFISVGALTHSARALDVSFEIQ